MRLALGAASKRQTARAGPGPGPIFERRMGTFGGPRASEWYERKRSGHARRGSDCTDHRCAAAPPRPCPHTSTSRDKGRHHNSARRTCFVRSLGAARGRSRGAKGARSAGFRAPRGGRDRTRGSAARGAALSRFRGRAARCEGPDAPPAPVHAPGSGPAPKWRPAHGPTGPPPHQDPSSTSPARQAPGPRAPRAGRDARSQAPARLRSIPPAGWLAESTGLQTTLSRPVSTGGGTRRVRLVREEGRGVSSQYGRGGGTGLQTTLSPLCVAQNLNPDPKLRAAASPPTPPPPCISETSLPSSSLESRAGARRDVAIPRNEKVACFLWRVSTASSTPPPKYLEIRRTLESPLAERLRSRGGRSYRAQ